MNKVKQEPKIGVCIMVHNMATLIKATIESLYWVDSIYIFDDNSTDDSLNIALQSTSVPIKFEKSTFKKRAFEQGELEVRNYLVDKSFKVLGVDVLIILDADELLSSSLKIHIVDAYKSGDYDSIIFSTYHLYDEDRYVHFWEDKINNHILVDPHTRVIWGSKRFEPLFEDGSHPIININEKTKVISGNFHYHLKYFFKSKLPNYSLFFLPERITENDVKPYLRDIKLQSDIKDIIHSIKWDTMPYYESTPHYENRRIRLEDPKDALIHPKYRND